MVIFFLMAIVSAIVATRIPRWKKNLDEGHGVRSFPAMIDYAARIVDWFTRHIPADEA